MASSVSTCIPTAAPSSITARVARFFRVSYTDLIFLAILAWTVILPPAGWSRLLWDGETGLQIRIGDFILQNGYVPDTDPFSFTRQGTSSLAWEWLTDVIFSSLNAHFGLKGVVFVCGVTIAVTLVVLLRTCLVSGANSLIAVVAVLMSANAVSFHYHARPHVITWLFLAISMAVLHSDAREPQKSTWLLAPLAAIWANVHGGFAVLFVVLGVMILGAILEVGFRHGRTLRLTALATVCGLATMLNPFGWRLHVEILRYLRDNSILNTIQEFQAPNFRSEPQLYFMLLLFAGLTLCGLLIAKRRYTQALLVITFAYFALVSLRHIPIYVIVALPVIVGEFTLAWNTWVVRQPRKSTAAIVQDIAVVVRDHMAALSIWSAVALAALFLFATNWPQDFPSDRFPVEISNRHSGELANSRLFTTDQWADYLMFRNPAQRVFLDDRSFYDQQIIADALNLMDAGPGWRQLLEKYRINAVLCPAGTLLAIGLAEDNRWTLLDKDATRMLFMARKF